MNTISSVYDVIITGYENRKKIKFMIEEFFERYRSRFFHLRFSYKKSLLC